MVSLHACDTTTDEALAQAVRWNVQAILAVPCCQKEAYRQIRSDLLAPAVAEEVTLAEVSPQQESWFVAGVQEPAEESQPASEPQPAPESPAPDTWSGRVIGS